MDVKGFVTLLAVLVLGVIIMWAGWAIDSGITILIGAIFFAGAIVGFIWYFFTSSNNRVV